MNTIFGFIFADEMEYKPFQEYALANGGVVVSEEPDTVVKLATKEMTVFAIHSGIGKVNAALAAALLSENYGVDYIMSAGLSGAISHLRKGDIVAGATYVECDFDLREFGLPLGKKSDGTFRHSAGPQLLKAALQLDGVVEGNFGTGDFFLTDPAVKESYRKTFQIQAFDMESAAIAAVCDKLNVPFLSVRKISDDADDSALDSYRAMNALAESALSEILMEIARRVA